MDSPRAQAETVPVVPHGPGDNSWGSRIGLW